MDMKDFSRVKRICKLRFAFVEFELFLDARI